MTIKTKRYPRIAAKIKHTDYFPYGNFLTKTNVSRGRMESRIKKKEFDIIITFDKDYLYKKTINEIYHDDAIIQI